MLLNCFSTFYIVSFATFLPSSNLPFLFACDHWNSPKKIIFLTLHCKVYSLFKLYKVYLIVVFLIVWQRVHKPVQVINII